jgi:hypothetical protein
MVMCGRRLLVDGAPQGSAARARRGPSIVLVPGACAGHPDTPRAPPGRVPGLAGRCGVRRWQGWHERSTERPARWWRAVITLWAPLSLDVRRAAGVGRRDGAPVNGVVSASAGGGVWYPAVLLRHEATWEAGAAHARMPWRPIPPEVRRLGTTRPDGQGPSLMSTEVRLDETWS